MYNQAKINGFTCLIATITHNLRRYHLTLLTVYYLALAKNQCKVFIHASRKLIQTYFPFIAICNFGVLKGQYLQNMHAWHQLLFSALKNCYFHSGIDICVETFPFLWVILIDIVTQIIVANFISFLIFSIIW